MADRAFLAEGPQAVREAFARAAEVGGGIREVFATADAMSRHSELVEQALALGVPLHRASGQVMAEVSDTVTPQGFVAVCSALDVSLADVAAVRPRLVAVLAAVRDPGNAGTVIRAADAAGADAVVLTDSSVDVYNGKCVRASAGSLFHLPVVTGAPVADVVEALKAAGLQVLAADGTAALDVDEADDRGVLAKATAWLFGNEAWGLPENVRGLADDVVRVPIHGRAESLNLATAAALCLYSSARAQRRGR